MHRRRELHHREAGMEKEMQEWLYNFIRQRQLLYGQGIA